MIKPTDFFCKESAKKIDAKDENGLNFYVCVLLA